FTPVTQPAPELVTFGMVARFEPIKNHALLLDAVAILVRQTQQFRVKLIGQGHLQAEIQQRMTQLGLTDFIDVLPYCHDMPSFYQQIDVGVLTSFAEGIPRALIEPMACGKPVLCTNVKGSREALVEGVTGFTVPLNSPAQLAEKMLWFIENPEARQRMGQAARRHVEQHFSAERIINTLGELYLSCAPTALTAEQTT
ncbi:MAG: glycosyltransferase, partial [Thiothrix sp.]